MKIEKVTSSTYRLTDRNSRINVGLVVTKDGALLVDSGSTAEMGQEIGELISDVTSQPVAYVVNTHHHLEHSGGNGAFTAPILSHVSCYHSMLREKKRLTLQGEDLSRFSLPEICFSDKGYVMLGTTFVEFVPTPGHTEGSIAVHLPSEGVLFGGDAFSMDPIPVDETSDLPRWIESVRRVRSLDVERIIPGRNDTYGREGLESLEASLERIAGGAGLPASRIDAATGLLRFDPNSTKASRRESTGAPREMARPASEDIAPPRRLGNDSRSR